MPPTAVKFFSSLILCNAAVIHFTFWSVKNQNNSILQGFNNYLKRFSNYDKHIFCIYSCTYYFQHFLLFLYTFFFYQFPFALRNFFNIHCSTHLLFKQLSLLLLVWNYLSLFVFIFEWQFVFAALKNSHLSLFWDILIILCIDTAFCAFSWLGVLWAS